MATKQATIDELLDLLEPLNVRARKMFGEYGLYCDEKIVGFVCDDQLFLKITDEGTKLVKNPVFAPCYPGSKDYLLVDKDMWFEGDALIRLVKTTADALPQPKPKKRNLKEK